MKRNIESKPSGSGLPAESNQSQTGLSPVGQQSPIGLLTREQVAQRWGCCTHTIARRKDLQPVRLGPRLVRYRLVDVEAIERAASGDEEGQQ